jgi:hypothetical protein
VQINATGSFPLVEEANPSATKAAERSSTTTTLFNDFSFAVATINGALRDPGDKTTCFIP